jgi:hypothetical protein
MLARLEGDSLFKSGMASLNVLEEFLFLLWLLTMDHEEWLPFHET